MNKLTLFAALSAVMLLCGRTLSAEPVWQSINLLPKRTIPYGKLGTNAFVNDLRFGSIRNQYLEVRNTLKLKYVRSLFAWTSAVQPARGGASNFSFYDDVSRSLPRGLQAVVVLTGLPQWMNDPKNWINGSPRDTFVELWVKPVARRYRRSRRIRAWQIWNEPNDNGNPDNILLDVAGKPENYLDLLVKAERAVHAISPGKRVIMAATTAVNQNFSETQDYNQALIEGGIEQYTHRFALHVYGYQLENFYRPGGVLDLVGRITKRIWVTESGAQGVNAQLSYAQRMWPFLNSNIRNIERIYQYQFTEATAPDITYGLRNLSPSAPVSDLYINLRDRK